MGDKETPTFSDGLIPGALNIRTTLGAQVVLYFRHVAAINVSDGQIIMSCGLVYAVSEKVMGQLVQALKIVVVS